MENPCSKCNVEFGEGEEIVYANNNPYHSDCFVCFYCFRPFDESKFFESEGFLYCEEDYKTLYSPICSECGKPVMGKVIKTSNSSWHVDCFKCFYCKTTLKDSVGCVFYKNKICCKQCSKLYSVESFNCNICKKQIPPKKHIFFRGVPLHPWHYLCNQCGNELNEDTEENSNKLFCKNCYDYHFSLVCEACKKIIKDERSVFSCGYSFHSEHFWCSTCGQVLANKAYFEKDNLPYCEEDFRKFFGNICSICRIGISANETIILNRTHCFTHHVCYVCLKPLEEKCSIEFDGKPICKKCMDKLPKKLKRNLK